MEEIRRTKIKEAMKETLNVYEKLDLNMTEIEIVSRSQNVVAKVVIAKKQLETEAGGIGFRNDGQQSVSVGSSESKGNKTGEQIRQVCEFINGSRGNSDRPLHTIRS